MHWHGTAKASPSRPQPAPLGSRTYKANPTYKSPRNKTHHPRQVHPRGVKLELGPAGEVPLVDTLVMSNLGYFQLKAAPGEWTLGLAPGRSRELFSVARDDELEADQGMEGAAAPRNQGGLTFELPVTVDSLMGGRLKEGVVCGFGG